MLDIVDDQLVVEEKGIYSIEKFLIARRLMYWQVYLHKTVVSAENMLIKALQRAKLLIINNKNIFTTPFLEKFLKNNFTKEDFKKNSKLLNSFAELDDSEIITCLKYWRYSEDFVLSNISTRILDRNLLKIKITKKQIISEEINNLIYKFCKKNNCSNEEARFFIFSSTLSNNTYNITKSNINILMKNGDIIDITDASDQFSINDLNKTVKKYFLCYTNDSSL